MATIKNKIKEQNTQTNQQKLFYIWLRGYIAYYCVKTRHNMPGKLSVLAKPCAVVAEFHNFYNLVHGLLCMLLFFKKPTKQQKQTMATKRKDNIDMVRL